MREFCKFNDIYERINVLEESVSKNFPGLKTSWSKAAGEARKIGASAPTREAKSAILNIIVGLMSKRIGRELTTQEERDLLRFRNIPSQKPLVEFLKTQEIDGKTYASVINDASPADIEEAAAGTGIADPVKFQVGQRSEERKEAYKKRAEARAEARAMADAAQDGGDDEFANSLDEVGDVFSDLTSSISASKEDPTHIVEIKIGDASLASEVKRIMAKYANKDGVEVSGNTVQFSADPGSSIAAIVGKVGVEAAEKALQKDIGAVTDSAVVIIPPDNDTAIEDQETPELRGSAVAANFEDGEGHAMSFSDKIRGQLKPGVMILVDTRWYAVDDVAGDKVLASDDDGGDHEFYIDDIETVDTVGIEDVEETVTESYTSMWMADQKSSDKRNVKTVTESVSFKERFKPKTSQQLEELRRYGL